jgi:hypothetical protein
MCDHCWHSFNSIVVRDNINVHGPFCLSHPDTKKPHEHVVAVHKKKCCQCGNVKTVYDEFIDTGEKAKKK